MADHYRPRPVGAIIDHPALENFEFVQQLREPFSALLNLEVEPAISTGELWEHIITGADLFPSAPNDRFVGHERDPVLQQGPGEDPLEDGDGYASDDDWGMDFEIDEILQIRSDSHRDSLVAAGFEPEPRVVEYEPCEDVLADTTLAEPEFEPAGPSNAVRLCRHQRAEQIRFAAVTADFLEDVLDEHREEKRRTDDLESQLDEYHGSLTFNRRRIPKLEADLLTAGDAFFATDASNFESWMKHVANSQKCTNSQSRAWQIAMFYRQGVPDDLLEAVRALAQCLIEIAADTLSFKKVQVELETEGVVVPCCRPHTFYDDDYWTVAAKEKTGLNLYFGDDYRHDLMNGFTDYIVPEGKSGVALAQHIMANLETRKVRVEHEGNLAKRTTVIGSYSRFIDKVQSVVDIGVDLLLGENSVKNPPAEAIPQMQADLQAFKRVHTTLFDARAQFGLSQDDNSRDLLPEST